MTDEELAGIKYDAGYGVNDTVMVSRSELLALIAEVERLRGELDACACWLPEDER